MCEWKMRVENGDCAMKKIKRKKQGKETRVWGEIPFSSVLFIYFLFIHRTICAWNAFAIVDESSVSLMRPDSALSAHDSIDDVRWVGMIVPLPPR